MKFVDLSTTIESGLPSDPVGMIPEIKYKDHKDSIEYMLSFFGTATPEDLPDGLAWALEDVTLTTHAGTHLDAPYHYHPTMNNGERAWTIDEVPLEWCYGDGVVVDFTHKPDGSAATIEDFEKEFERLNYNLKPGDIVLVNTGASKKWGSIEYLSAGCGMGREVTLWLIEQGIHVMGTDAWSWDRPLKIVGKEFDETGDKSIIWEGHFAGIEKAYCHIEKLANLDQVPATGFKFSCFPVKLKAASGGWIRAVAMIDE
ncbi:MULTISPECIES: cyclase family protein [unclassified Enterococcus]|uniref:cyclase family protein n=1 Tax=unclassified Enterococcus TaxID=2608891 RepID=UPI001CE07FF1|nr:MULTISPECIES: cyclase family protein [unclassified Enterococcus]MCA5013946.1 cyclase family protein [Enterococcus sp. S23]MCA5017280.1 cyclase family protein [Enterococcus sp. S22(2020)]